MNSFTKYLCSLGLVYLSVVPCSQSSGSEIAYCELTGVMELAGSLRVSLSSKQSGHLGWLKVGQARMGITVLSASSNPPAATVSDGSETTEMRLKEPIIKPLDLIEKIRNRAKSDAEISIDANMVMSYQRIDELRKERAAKKREARLKRRK